MARLLQGSALSPVLYDIYTSDTPRGLTHTKIYIYPYDTTKGATSRKVDQATKYQQ